MNCEYDSISTFIWNDLIWFSLTKKKKKGFYNPENNYLHDPNSDWYFNFFQDNGNAQFELDGKWGMINISGEIILPPIYDSIGSITILEDSKGYIRAELDNKFGFINSKGEWLIEPKFESLGLFITHDNQDTPLCGAKQFSKWGLIDRKGSFVVNPQFDDFKNFENGVAIVVQNEKKGLIKENGEFVFEPIYDWITPIDTQGKVTASLNEKEVSVMLPQR